MESLQDQPETIRVAMATDGLGKLVREGHLQNMIAIGQQPDYVRLSPADKEAQAFYLRRKIEEELEELRSAKSHTEMIKEVAGFLTVADTFHRHVEATPEDSFNFGRFQRMLHTRAIRLSEAESLWVELDRDNGTFENWPVVRSIALSPDDPWRQYYLDHPERFPIMDEPPPDCV